MTVGVQVNKAGEKMKIENKNHTFQVSQEHHPQVKSYIWKDTNRQYAKDRLFITVELEKKNGIVEVLTDEVFQVV